MNLSKLLVKEIRAIMTTAEILPLDELLEMPKKALIEYCEEMLDDEDMAGLEAAYKELSNTEEGDEFILSMDDIRAEMESTAKEVIADDVDLKKLRMLSEKMGKMSEALNIAEEVQKALRKVKMPRQGASTITIKAPVGKDVKVEGLVHKQFKKVLQLVSQRIPTLLVGPSGAGKTHLAAQVAEAVKARAFSAISCSVGMSEGHVQGWLLPTGDGGKFEYEKSAFIDIVENGGVFLIDEIDSADENMLVILNMLLSNGRMYVPQRTKNPEVVMHEDCIILAAANTFGNGADAQYVGRNQLDAATLDRFRVGMVFIDYDTDVEAALCDPDILEWGHAIRANIAEHGIRRIMSTRTMRTLSVMKTAYPNEWGTRRTWERQYFADWSDDEKRLVA